MRTLEDCQLAVSIYPTFSYDARGGGGIAETTGQGCDAGKRKLFHRPHGVMGMAALRLKRAEN